MSDEYTEWWSDFCMDDATPEERAAIEKYLETGVYVEPGSEPSAELADETDEADTSSTADDLRVLSFDAHYGHFQPCNYDLPDDADDFSSPIIPVCNHAGCVLEENIGYTTGTMEDGTHFEAELYRLPDGVVLSVVLPEKRELIPDSEFKARLEDVKAVEGGQYTTATIEDNGLLAVGMVVREDDVTLKEIQNYVGYLERMGIVEFAGENRNGHVLVLTDIEGNDLVRCDITLHEGEMLWATTDLEFQPFPGTGFTVL